MRSITIFFVGALLLVAGGCDDGGGGRPSVYVPKPSELPPVQHESNMPDSVDKIEPLAVGDTIPDAKVNTLLAERLNLSDLIEGKPAVLVFYRGPWCAHAQIQLAALNEHRSDFESRGFQLIAISPTDPTRTLDIQEKLKFKFTMISDLHTEAIERFGVGYRLDEATAFEFANNGYPLASDPATSERVINVPAVFIVDETGTIRFAQHTANHSTPMKAETILDALDGVIAENRPSETE